MRDTVPSLAVEGSAMMALPPRDLAAPRLKSTCPPTPEKNFEPMRIGADLAGEIHFQRGVDRHHLVLLADDVRDR